MLRIGRIALAVTASFILCVNVVFAGSIEG